MRQMRGEEQRILATQLFLYRTGVGMGPPELKHSRPRPAAEVLPFKITREGSKSTDSSPIEVIG